MTGTKVSFESSVENDLLNSEGVKNILDKYQIIDKIHQSSISQIFVLRDHSTKELLILKAINKNTEFIWDLEAIKEISHPLIARVIDVQSTNRYIYILKEYIKGVTLEQYISKVGSLCEADVLHIGMMLCEIIGYFHSIKPFPIIYRDLKPANIILTEDGSVRLIDLDSVRRYKENSQKDTFYIGTEGFASPEQFGFSQTDNRTDIYTIGTTLYFLLAGKKPESDKFRLKSIKCVRSDISDAMCEIIEKCTSFNPDNRYQNVNELRNDLLELHSKDLISFVRKKAKRIFRKKRILAIAVSLLITVSAIVYFFSENNSKNVSYQTPESSPVESRTDLIITQNRELNTKNNDVKDLLEEKESFSFERTTILEAFWSGSVPQKLPASFVEYYKKQDSSKYNQSVFFIAIEEWDSSQNHLQMNDRVKAVGGEFVLKAEGYRDVQVELNGDSMTHDGNAQVYFAYVRNAEDMVSGIKYKIVDTSGHWIIGDDVFVERKEKADEKASFSFDKTTISEAFWSGDVPKTLSQSFIDYYKSQNMYKYSKSLFFISIEEWDMGNTSQMIDRIKSVGGKLKLHAKGHKDIDVILSGSNITSNRGDGQLYLAYVQNESDLVSGVKYDIIDETGHWIVKEGVYVLRPVEDIDFEPFSYDITTISEAIWSGELPKSLPTEFVEFYKQQYSYKYDPILFFIAIKEWDFTQDHSQMNQRLVQIGTKLLLKADGYKDIDVELNGRTMTAGNGLAQLYAAVVQNAEDMVSGVKYSIIDETGHWIVNEDVYVERPEY